MCYNVRMNNPAPTEIYFASPIMDSDAPGLGRQLFPEYQGAEDWDGTAQQRPAAARVASVYGVHVDPNATPGDDPDYWIVRNPDANGALTQLEVPKDVLGLEQGDDDKAKYRKFAHYVTNRLGRDVPDILLMFEPHE